MEKKKTTLKQEMKSAAQREGTSDITWEESNAENIVKGKGCGQTALFLLFFNLFFEKILS